MHHAVEKYLEYMKTLCPVLKQKELSFIEKGLIVSHYDSKEYYFEDEDIQNKIGFVYKGLLRSFYIDKDGNDITVRFMAENDYITNYSSFLSQQSGKYFFQCIEPCVIVNISYDLIQEGYKRFPNIDKYGRLVAEAIIKIQQQRIENFLFFSAEDRYLNFINCHPTIFNRVSLSHLSTYLGITRPSLSRIRKKLSLK